MKARTVFAAALTLVAAACILSIPGLAADEAPRIAKEEVKALLDDPNVSILDARISPDWNKSDIRIKGAVRVDPLDVGVWAGNYPKDKKLIVYCA